MNCKLLFFLLFVFSVVTTYAQPQKISELKSQYVTINDSIKVHYKVWDNQQPDVPKQAICFVHGFGCDMNTWQKQFEGLRDQQNLRLVFIDLPGYGKSSKPHVDYTLDFFAHAVDEVLNANNIWPAILVGHSLGSPVCRRVMLTTRHIGGLVDVDGVYCFYDGKETPEYVSAIKQFAKSFDGPQCSNTIIDFLQSLKGPDTPKEITDYALSTMPETPEYVASSTMHNLIDRKYWPQFAMPLDVMVLCTQTSGLEPDNQDKLRKLFPQMDYTELTTCGHFIHMEQPEMFNEKLKSYAAKVLNNGLEDYDFTVRNLEENYAGFPFKVNATNREEWNRVKQELRDSAATGSYYVPVLISDLCCWFQDFHLSCTYNYSSDRFKRNMQDYKSQMTVYSPQKLSARVDKKTWLLRFPTWQGDDEYCQWVKDAIEEYRQSGCTRLIVDIRGNSGGSDGQYKPLLSLLFAKTGDSDGMMMRNTKENRDRTREVCANDEYWLDLMDKCEKDTAAYSLLFDKIHIEQDVDKRRPKKTAVIFDNVTASSSEQLLLELRATAPDVRFYARDNTLGCIDVSNIRSVQLPHAPNSLRIPVTVSQRLTEGRNMIDGKGIEPDVRINLPLPISLTSNIDSWVQWVAKNIK